MQQCDCIVALAVLNDVWDFVVKLLRHDTLMGMYSYTQK